MRKFLLVTASLVSFNLASGAYAGPAEDAAYNKSNRPIVDTQGDCVRTKWMDDKDPCAPDAPPKPKPPVVVKPAPTPLANVTREQLTIYFDFNSSKLNSEATAKLDNISNIINKSSEITDVKIHGYTDQIGTNSYNDALANKRAGAVKGYLDGRSRLKSTQGDIRGLGKSETDGSCADIKKRTEKIACMAPQRRVEVEFIAKE